MIEGNIVNTLTKSKFLSIMTTEMIIYKMKMTEEKCRATLFDATMRLYGFKILGAGIALWGLCALISYLTTDTVSSLLFWVCGVITLVLMIIAVVSFDPDNTNTSLGIPFIQKKILHELARRNNLLLLMNTEILDHAKSEVIIRGRSSYLRTLKNRYEDFFKILKKSPNFKLNYTQMEYGSYWWHIERYIEHSEELREMLAKSNISSPETTTDEVHKKLSGEKEQLTFEDWMFLERFSLCKYELERYRKDIQQDIEDGEILKSFIAKKLMVLENLNTVSS
jgi:hypothetical protein